MRAFRAFSSSLSPSWKSMARLVLPSRLELKRPEGSSNEALGEGHLHDILVRLTGADHSPNPGHLFCNICRFGFGQRRVLIRLRMFPFLLDFDERLARLQ